MPKVQVPIRSVGLCCCTILVVAVLVLGVGGTFPRPSSSRPAFASVEAIRPNKHSIFLTTTGRPLKSLFEGLERKPGYSLERILKQRHVQALRDPGCGDRPTVTVSFWQRIIAAIQPTAHAQYTCTETRCSGTQFVFNWQTCEGVTACSGTRDVAEYDPIFGNPNTGSRQDGRYCGSEGWCGCYIPTCSNGGF